MEIYIQIIVTAICTIAYILTFKYQTGKIGILEGTLKTLNDQVSSQSKIITDFEKYKSLFDIDDFEKRLKFKLDTQSEELSALYKKEIKNALKEPWVKALARKYRCPVKCLKLPSIRRKVFDNYLVALGRGNSDKT